MRLGATNGDGSAEIELDLRIRELEATVVAMREAFELAEREAHDRLQQALADAAAEADELKATIGSLREELEGQERGHVDALQQQRQAASEEAKGLQATIAALRDELEAASR